MAAKRSPIGSVLVTLLLLLTATGCNPLRPRAILHGGYRVAPELLTMNQPQIERGRPCVVVDSVGWFVGIPGRLLLWDPRIDNHQISKQTEGLLTAYLMDNELSHVKVRLNQYAPLQDWKRLRNNKTVGWGYRYTLGVLSLAGETLLPGRIFGGDRYNPYTATIHLYSDVPAIAMHEAAHAKDFSRRKWQGTYAAVYLLSPAPLWHERIATSDVLYYTTVKQDDQLQREAYRILYPAYGTYVGSSLGMFLPKYADPLYITSVLVGHAAAHHHAYALPELMYLSQNSEASSQPAEVHAVAYDEPMPELPGESIPLSQILWP